jgi:hypothetical protein
MRESFVAQMTLRTRLGLKDFLARIAGAISSLQQQNQRTLQQPVAKVASSENTFLRG